MGSQNPPLQEVTDFYNRQEPLTHLEQKMVNE